MRVDQAGKDMKAVRIDGPVRVGAKRSGDAAVFDENRPHNRFFGCLGRIQDAPVDNGNTHQAFLLEVSRNMMAMRTATPLVTCSWMTDWSLS